jgi:drug/metabolite transporter (DMT)-like permease
VTVAPALVVAAVAVVWGSIGVLVRWVDLPATVIVWARVTIAATALGAWLAFRRGRTEGAPLLRYQPWRTLAAGVLLAGHWVALFAALRRAPIWTVLLVTYLAPVGIAATAPLVLRERVGGRTLAALGVALAGTALVVSPAVEGASATGVALAGLAAGSYVVLVLVSKPLSQVYGGVKLAFLEMVAASVVLVPSLGDVPWDDAQPSWAWLLVLGVVHTALGVGLYLSALARLPATSVGILGYLEPASAVVFGWLLLSEDPGPATLVGGALIVVAGAVVMRAGREDAVVTREVAERVPG